MERKSFEPWNLSGRSDFLEGFSWPPRSYACSFCQREFRSAQALGGHMNVHRRDRARLRQSPTRPSNSSSIGSFLNLSSSSSSTNPNPNPSFSPPLPLLSKSTLLPPPFTLPSPSLSSPTYSASNERGAEEKRQRLERPYCRVENRRSTALKEDCGGYKVVKRGDIVRLDLEIGLLGASSELDLELRLGYS